MENRLKIWRRIAELRKEAGLSQRALAERTGFNPSDKQAMTVQKILAKIREDYGREIKDRSED